MSNNLEELQAKKYLEHLLSVGPAQWQWFSAQQCFEVGDASARPRVYFDVEGQYETYMLAIYLEVDRVIVSSSSLHIRRRQPSDHDELLRHLLQIDQPPLSVVLIARLLRNRNVMATASRPDHVGVKIGNHFTVLKQKILVDLPHNVQERMTMFKLERNASRVQPRSRRAIR